MQSYLKQLMNDLIGYLLGINIPVQNNVSRKRLFDFAISTIEYYHLI